MQTHWTCNMDNNLHTKRKRISAMHLDGERREQEYNCGVLGQVEAKRGFGLLYYWGEPMRRRSRSSCNRESLHHCCPSVNCMTHTILNASILSWERWSMKCPFERLHNLAKDRMTTSGEAAQATNARGKCMPREEVHGIKQLVTSSVMITTYTHDCPQVVATYGSLHLKPPREGCHNQCITSIDPSNCRSIGKLG